MKSRLSEITKGSFRAKALRKLEEAKKESAANSVEKLPEPVEEQVEEITYDSDKALAEDKE